MSLLGATILTGIATAVLAAGAIVTAVLAYLAVRKQSREVQAIERQVADGQELARQQAELLKIQSGQLELQREQLEDQRKASMKQADVLDLQAAELRESLEERKREAERRRRAQAALVFLDQTIFRGRTDHEAFGAKPPDAEVAVVNSSDQPIYEVELRWHRGSASWGEPNPELLGVILPGEHVKHRRVFESGTNMDASGAVLQFRDAAGIVWMRRPDGGLTEQP